MRTSVSVSLDDSGECCVMIQRDWGVIHFNGSFAAVQAFGAEIARRAEKQAYEAIATANETTAAGRAANDADNNHLPELSPAEKQMMTDYHASMKDVPY